jgi:hypothetical protein
LIEWRVFYAINLGVQMALLTRIIVDDVDVARQTPSHLRSNTVTTRQSFLNMRNEFSPGTTWTFIEPRQFRKSEGVCVCMWFCFPVRSESTERVGGSGSGGEFSTQLENVGPERFDGESGSRELPLKDCNFIVAAFDRC